MFLPTQKAPSVCFRFFLSYVDFFHDQTDAWPVIINAIYGSDVAAGCGCPAARFILFENKNFKFYKIKFVAQAA